MWGLFKRVEMSSILDYIKRTDKKLTQERERERKLAIKNSDEAREQHVNVNLGLCDEARDVHLIFSF